MEIGGGVPDHYNRYHVHGLGLFLQILETGDLDSLAGPECVAHDADRSVSGSVLKQYLPGFQKLALPPVAARVV